MRRNELALVALLALTMLAQCTPSVRFAPTTQVIDHATSTPVGSCEGCAVAVRFVGRRDAADPEHPRFAWPGGRIIARFRGTAATVTLDEEARLTGPSRWDVLVDGAPLSTLVPVPGPGTYTIAVGLPDTVHTIELYRRTEAMVGVTRFMGYAFPNGGQLLAPPAAPARRIEFLGDSTTSGYGNECTSPKQSFSGATQNERLAFSGLVANALNADHHDLSASGKGVLLNYHRADPVVFERLFVRAMPEDEALSWDFSSFTPDVVWMNLGGNDWDRESSSSPRPDLAAYTKKYGELVALVRSKYPSAHFFCSITPSLNDALTGQRAAIANVVGARIAAGDTKIYAYEFARATESDLTGCDYHTNLALHRKMADEVIAQIKARTGWL